MIAPQGFQNLVTRATLLDIAALVAAEMASFGIDTPINVEKSKPLAQFPDGAYIVEMRPSERGSQALTFGYRCSAGYPLEVRLNAALGYAVLFCKCAEPLGGFIRVDKDVFGNDIYFKRVHNPAKIVDVVKGL